MKSYLIFAICIIISLSATTQSIKTVLPAGTKIARPDLAVTSIQLLGTDRLLAKGYFHLRLRVGLQNNGNLRSGDFELQGVKKKPNLHGISSELMGSPVLIANLNPGESRTQEILIRIPLSALGIGSYNRECWVVADYFDKLKDSNRSNNQSENIEVVFEGLKPKQ